MKSIFKKITALKKDDNIEAEIEEIEEEYYEDDDINEYEEEMEQEVEEIEDEEDNLLDEEEQKWIEESDNEEGQLSIDVYQNANEIIVKSTIAGVKSDDIDIAINNDMLTIRGKREMTDEIRSEDYLFRECYWGAFSRSIILPVEVEAEKIDADLENGVLTITLPKAKSAKEITIKVKEKN